MDGQELISHLENLNPDMRTIFLTGANDSAIERPNTVCMRKPATSIALLRTIKKLLGRTADQRSGNFWWLDPARRLHGTHKVGGVRRASATSH